ncbi:MAG: geranylgeranylglycerol-phosphate geranylgeranyltransferase [Ferruginibacter sp.]|nr:geranylgeranylglycerol-phosphate geranylgeranyltransferase [Ferruginibacter sp.]
MKLIIAFLRLIRWPNLVFIAITQWLFYFFVVESLQTANASETISASADNFLFYLLILASVLIAAAGYIINDYFDLNIDAINKPDKVVVDRTVKRRWAIAWHLVFSFTGILLSLYISYKTGTWIIVVINSLCVLLLWLYSTTFKKKLLTGNVIISALTAWVIIVVYFFAGAAIINYNGWHEGSYAFDVKKLYKFTILYAGFAFILSLIREVVKDLEDMHGDAKYHCKTMPIEWGVPASKVFTAVWIIVCSASLTIIQIYVWQSGWWLSAVYCILFIILPLLFILKELKAAVIPADYHRISSIIKLVMLTGILSMLFFKFYS